MIEDQAKKIRSLTDDFFHGLLDHEAYQRERGNVLDALVGLEPVQAAEVDNTIRLGVGSLEEAPQTTQETVPVQAPDGEPPAPRSNLGPSLPELPVALEKLRETLASPEKRPMVIGAAAVFFVLLVVLLWPSSEAPESDPEVSEVFDGRHAAPEVEPVAARAGSDYLWEFMASPQWVPERISAFLFDWDELTEAEHAELRQSEEFRQFVLEVQNRIQVDRAIGASAAEDGLTLGEALAVELELGLVDPRQPMPEEVVVVPEPLAPEKPAMVTNLEASPAQQPVTPEDAAEKQVTERSMEPAAPVPEKQVVERRVEPDTPPARVADLEARKAIAQPREPETPQETPAVRASDQPCSVERLNTRSATCWDMLAESVRGPFLRVLPGGEFIMGQEGDATASPAHTQHVEQPFAIGVFEITVAEYGLFCQAAGVECPEKRWSSDTYPVVDVSWHNAVAYANWLTATTGAPYRLPTEAEWEYAARAGTTTRYPFGDSISPTDARYDSGSNSVSPLPTDDRTTRKNDFRLWHVAGNVREWTSDPWRSSYSQGAANPNERAIRGGSYADPPDRLRSAAREGAGVDYFDSRTGFRIVREL